MILGNAWIVTTDDAGTEHERGRLQIDDGLVRTDEEEIAREQRIQAARLST